MVKGGVGPLVSQIKDPHHLSCYISPHTIVQHQKRDLFLCRMTDEEREYLGGREREWERDDRKEVKNYNPPSFPWEVTAIVMYNPGTGKLIR